MLIQKINISDYLLETTEINFSHPTIQKLSEVLFTHGQSEIEKINVAFEFVRDEIAHSWDIQSNRVTKNASEVLAHKEGICYAKSHLLAALLRNQNIPTGFCYQRLLLFERPEQGYCIHALNAVYISSLDKWIRLDARGNKPGVSAQFSLEEEKLAFLVDSSRGEIDYPTIYSKPHEKTLTALSRPIKAIELYKFHLPTSL